MSNDEQHDRNDLFGGIEGNDSSIGAAPMNNEEGDQLDLSPSEAHKAKMANDFARKVKLGELTLEDVGEKQAWIKPLVEDLLKKDEKPSVPAVTKEDFISVAREEAKKLLESEKLEREREASNQRFEELKEKIQTLALTASERQTLQSEYKGFLEEGFSEEKALKLAAKVANIDFEDTRRLRRNYSLPKTGGEIPREVNLKEIDIGSLNANSLTDEQLYQIKKAKRGY